MKYIVYFIVCIALCKPALAQRQTIGNKKNSVIANGRLGADSAILFPKDTIKLGVTDRAIAFKDKWRWWNGTYWDSLTTSATLNVTDPALVINKNFSAGYSDYTLVSPNAFTLTQVSNGITVVGATSTITNFLYKTTGVYTSSNQWTSSLKFIYTADGGGIGVGISTQGSPADGIVARASFALGVASLELNKPITFTTWAASVGTFTVTPGDELMLLIRREGRYVFAALYKPSTNQFITVQKAFASNTTESLVHRSGTPAVYFTGGTFTIKEHKFNFKQSKFKFALFGNSVSEGGFANTGAQLGYETGATYFNQLNKEIGNGLNFSSGGNNTINTDLTIKDAAIYQPVFGIVNIGINDAISGTSQATFESNYKAILYKLISNDIIPIVVTVQPWAAVSTAINTTIVGYKNFITGLSPDLKAINTWALLNNGTNGLITAYDHGDGHPNAYGHTVIAEKIKLDLAPVLQSGLRYGEQKIGTFGRAFSMYDLNNSGFTEIYADKDLKLTTGTDYNVIAAGKLTNKAHNVATQAGFPLSVAQNVLAYNSQTTTTGAFIINSPITSTSTNLFRIHVKGYIFGTSTVINFIVSGFANASAITNYTLTDLGNDGLTKTLGINSSGNVAIAIGAIGTSSVYPRFSVDYMETFFASTGTWSVNLSTVAGFGFTSTYALASNIVTGSITGVTEATADNSTKLASTAFVKNQGYLTTASAATSYIQNTTVQQASSNFNISGAGVIGTTLNLTGANGFRLGLLANVAGLDHDATTGFRFLNSSNAFTRLNVGSLYINALANDNTETNFIVWNATDRLLEYKVILTGSATLDFTSTAAQTNTDLTIAATGVALNDVVSVGVPHAAMLDGVTYSAWVSAVDVVSVRLNNYSTTAKDPASGTFKISVAK